MITRKPIPRFENTKSAFPDLVFNNGCAAWTPVFTAITANPTLPFLIVINPNSGPGSANTQPDTNYQSCIASLKSSMKRRLRHNSCRCINHMPLLRIAAHWVPVPLSGSLFFYPALD
ncbi:hypothetical protein B0H13DRAFT_1628611 [Mycena leptocephala]|nr:hypothetical protein B0H13DRAFT_1628611 [Mycena leptocephala]